MKPAHLLALAAAAFASATTALGAITDLAGNAISGLPYTAGETYILDNTAPTVSSITSSTANGTYGAGSSISIQVTFSEAVTVTGTPQLTLETATTDRKVNYASGTGTTTLTFSYTVQAGDASADLDYVATSSLALNGGTIRDAAGNNATLTLPTPGATNSLGANKALVIDGIAPAINSVTGPSSGSYRAGQTLSFSVTFSENVTVNTAGGTPRIALTVSSDTRYAAYASGSASSTLVFSYTVQAGDTDADGIAAATPVQLNSGTIRDAAGNDASLSFTAPSLTTVLVDTTAPTVSIGSPSVSSTATGPVTYTVTYADASFSSATLAAGHVTLNKTGTADGSVAVAGTGTTRTVTISSITGSGTLGISLAAGTASDVAGNTAPAAGPSTTFTVDSTAPAVASIARAPSTAVNTNASSAVFRVTFSEAVSGVDAADFALATVSGNASGAVASVASVSGSVYDVTVNTLSGLGGLRLNLKSSGTDIVDLVGNAIGGGFTTSDFYLVGAANVLDATTLTAGVGLPASRDNDFEENSYVALPFTTPASAPLTLYYVAATIGTIEGTPAPVVTIRENQSGNPGNVVATLTNPATLTANTLNVWTTSTTLAPSTSYWLVFGDVSTAAGVNLYNVQTVTSVTGGLGTWFTAGNYTYKFGGNPTWTQSNGSLRVGFGAVTAPAIASVTAPADGMYRAGATLDFTINYESAVTVSTAGGSPTLPLVVGATTRQAAYIAAESTGTALKFRYTVQAGENDSNGIAVNSPLALNGAVIRSAADVDALLSFTPPTTTGVLVDNTASTIASVAVPANGTYVAGQNLDFTINFDEAVTVVTTNGTPRLALTVGSTTRYASYLSGSGSTALVFRYTLQSGDLDADGIAVSTLEANGGTLRDAAGNDATLTLNSVGSTAAVLVDAVAPTIASATPPADGYYRAGQSLTFTVNVSENVTVNTGGGVPRLALTVGSTTRYANYVSGSGTTALVFGYTVQAGEIDADGVAVASPLELNGGTIRDAAGNAAALTFTAPPTTGVRVDTTAPTVAIGAPSETRTRSGPVSFTVTYSDVNFNASTLAAGNVTLNATGTASGSVAVTGTGATRTVTISSITGDGMLGISVAGGSGSDLAGNAAPGAGPSTTFIVDNTAPTLTAVAIASNNADPARGKAGDTVTLSFTASETIGTPTVTLAGRAATVTNTAGNNWTATLALAADDPAGAVVFSIAFSDLAGNAGTAVTATTNASSVTFDSTVPTLTSVTIASNNARPAWAKVGDNVVVTFTASEAVVTPTATVAGRAATVANTTGNTYTATVTMQAGDTAGAVAFSVAFSDLAGNAGTAVTAVTDTSSVTFDKTAPTLAIAAPSATRTRTGPITFEVTYTDTNFNASTLATGNITLNTTGTAAGNVAVTGTGATRTVTISSITGDGTLGISIAAATADDLAGNTAAASAASTTFIVDNTAPAIATIARHAPATVNTTAGTLSWRVTFAEDVTGVDLADFTLTTIVGAPAATLGSVTAVSASSYDVQVGSVSGQGRVRLDLKGTGTGIADLAGNAIGTSGFTSGDLYIVGVANVFDTVSLATGTTRAVSHATNAKVAQRFTTAATAPLSLTTVSAVLGAVTGTPTPVVTLHADDAGAPGAAVVATLTNPGSLTANALNVWTSTQLLAASTVYWVVFNDSSAAGAFEIKETAATTGGLGDWLTNADYAYRHGANAATAAAGALQIAIGATSTPTITSPLIASGTYGTPFAGYTITGTNLPTSFAATGLPTGLTLNSTSGQITGTPTQSGTFNVALTGTNTSGTGVPSTLVLTIAKAPLTITADPATRPYNTANPEFSVSYNGFVLGDSATVLTTAPAVSTSAVTTSPVGTYSLVPSGAVAANYTFTYVNGTLTITKAVATVSLSNLAQVFNGSGRAASVATTPQDLPVTVTYDGGATLPVAAGTYAVAATIDDPNYAGSATGTLTIGKAAATVTLGSLTHTFDAAAKSASVTTVPAGLNVAVTYNGSATAPSAAGSYAVVATVNDANYAGSASGTLTIGKATATITLANLAHTYNGSAKAATATTVPAGLPVTLTYNGSAIAPTNGGSYEVVATVDSPTHAGSATGTLTITKATQTIDFLLPALDPGAPVALNATASSGLPVGYTLVSGPASLSGGTLTASGSGTVTVRATQAGNENYEPASVERSSSVSGKLAQTITFPPIADRTTVDGAFTLSATSTSGLVVRFAVVSGPAVITGRTVVLTGAPGTVVVRAFQLGNTTFAPAPEVFRSFVVRDATPDTFFGDLLEESGSTLFAALAGPGVRPDGEGPPVQIANTRAGDIAAAIVTGTRQGTLLIVAAARGLNLSLEFTLDADGSYTIPVTHAGQTISVTGRLANGILSGRIPALRLRFETQVQSREGPTAAYAGFYKSDVLDAAQGATYSVVGTDGRALVLAITPAITTGGVAAVTNDGRFSLAASNVTIQGTVDAPTATVSGAIIVPGQPQVDFSGLRQLVLRTDRLINLSSRSRIGPSGDRTLITGFVVGGTEPKQVLLRAVGPGLTPLGVGGAIPNPRLMLYRGSELVLQNEDWSGEDTAAAFGAVGAFGLTSGSRDAALLTTLTPGAYTMHVIDGGDTGVALAEIYDASANPQGEYQRLINISSRGMVDAGDGVLIGGFVVTGNSPKKILVRGIGAALGKFGVAGALVDPRLTVYSGREAIAQNDNWSTPLPLSSTQVAATGAELATAALATGAFALDAGSRDAAVIVTLAPGAYTAQVTGVDGGTGVALVEIYEIPE